MTLFGSLRIKYQQLYTEHEVIFLNLKYNEAQGQPYIMTHIIPVYSTNYNR